MEERVNKTIICSVFFLDIIEYSKKSVSEQISLKERFNAFLSMAISNVPINDRVILDTGDGAAISFLGDVEDALRAALSVRGALLSEEGVKSPSLQVRMGINLGPVRLVRDINGQPNLVGDGINVAQRIMGFASTGQILVSRSYYDAASRLSHEYAGMFHFEGSRTDKHVREHEVYAIGYPGDFTGTQRRYQQRSNSKLFRFVDDVNLKIKHFWKIVCVWNNALIAHWREVFEQASNNKRALYVGLVTLPVLLLILLVIRLAYLDDEPKVDLPKVTLETALPVPLSSSGVQPGQAARIAKSKVTIKVSEVTEAKPVEIAAPVQSNTQKLAEKENESFKIVQTPAVSRANVILTIKPWGEVYVDGNMVGVSPPLIKLQLSLGEHVIEVRNTKFPVSTRVISLKAGMKVKVKHTFGN